MKLNVYTLWVLIVLLSATSCGKNDKAKEPYPQCEICDFDEADIEDSPTCGCENYPEAGKIYVVKFTAFVPVTDLTKTQKLI